MSTINIILMVVLVSMIVIAALLIVRYVRKDAELENKAAELDAQEKGLQKRNNSLDRWNAELKQNAAQQAKYNENRRHVYANVEVLDSDEEKPTAKSIGKSLSSKIGYALRREFPDIKERHDQKNGGRTVYSVDFYVAPYED